MDGQQRAAAASRRIADLNGPKGLPLLGNALQVDNKRVHLVLEAWAREHGPVFRVGLGPRKVLILTEPAPIQALMLDRPETFRRVTPVADVLDELKVQGVFSAEGEKWRRQRKLIMPAFSMRQQRELFPKIAKTTDRLCEHWRKAASADASVDARVDLMRYTVDVTSEVVFGRDLGTLSGNHSELQEHLANIFHMMNVRVNALFPYWRYLKLPRDRRVERSLAFVLGLIDEIIADARRAMERDPERAQNPRTLLEALIVAQDEEDPSARFSDSEVSGNVLTLLLAGEDTTSNTLTWILHYLAHEPEVQRKLREEADAVLGESRVVARYEDVAKLKYAMAVTHETLRLRSAAPVLFFEPTRDVNVVGVDVKPGEWIFCLTRHCGVSEASFSDATTFNPNRWLEGMAPEVHNARAALSFGAGPRTCPGRSLALFECAMVASMLGRNFEVQAVSARDEVDELFDFTMSPVGLRVRFGNRD